MVRILLLALVGLPFLAMAAVPGEPPTSIPGPASLAVLAIGAGTLLIARRLRK